MLTSYSHALSSQMTPPQPWKLTKGILVIFGNLPRRYCFDAATASTARAPPVRLSTRKVPNQIQTNPKGRDYVY